MNPITRTRHISHLQHPRWCIVFIKCLLAVRRPIADLSLSLTLESATLPLMLQETASTCRERCGGQGYLSCNRFGQIIGFGHAGVTAEGDNRVLMQKVAKERMLLLQKERLALPRAAPLEAGAVLGDPPTLLKLMESRDSLLLRDLARRMATQVGC